MASQKMCFPETVIIVQHFLVSITISPAVRLFLALLCGCVRVCVRAYVCVCVCPVNFCYVNVRLVLDISKRNHSFNKPIPHHAPEPQWENHIQHISQARFVPQFDTESFMGMRFLYVGECVFAYLYVRGFCFSQVLSLTLKQASIKNTRANVARRAQHYCRVSFAPGMYF